MKRFFILLFSFVLSTGCMFAFPVNFIVGFDNHSGVGPGHNKTPILIPEATLEGNQLEFQGCHSDYTLTLLDEDGEIVYQVFVPSTTTIVYLPTSLTGDFELRLDFGGSYYFYSYINL